MTQTKSVIRAVAKYDKTNTQGLYIKLHKTKDKDIIDKLESLDSKQGYIKNLIREDMQMDNWIPVTERLPEEGQDVLFCDIDGYIMIGYHLDKKPSTHFSEQSTFEDIKNVKAWMPLPQPYKEN